MFTGIIESLAIIQDVEKLGSNKTFRFKSSLAPLLKVDQSLSHNGICLTVESVENDMYTATAIDETLRVTNAHTWKTGDVVNLERCMLMNGRIDGHIVQGHVDATGRCTKREDKNGSVEFTIDFDKKHSTLVIEKGSIALNGISLTIFNVTANSFTVAIIPYTLGHTNMKNLREGDIVNLEFDMMGKYANRILGKISREKSA